MMKKERGEPGGERTPLFILLPALFSVYSAPRSSGGNLHLSLISPQDASSATTIMASSHLLSSHSMCWTFGCGFGGNRFCHVRSVIASLARTSESCDMCFKLASF